MSFSSLTMSNPLGMDRTRTSMTRGKLLLVVRKLFSHFKGSLKNTPNVLSFLLRPSSGFSSLSSGIEGFLVIFEQASFTYVTHPFEVFLQQTTAIEAILQKGIVRAYLDVRKMKRSMPSEGVAEGVMQEFVRSLLQGQSGTEQLQLLRNRVKLDLENIRVAMKTAVGRVISDNIPGSVPISAQPPESSLLLIKLVTAEVDNIGVRRCQLLINNEVVRWFSVGQLMAFGSLGIKTVKALPEQNKSGRLCSSCSKLMTPTPLGKAWGVLPLHPNCACVWEPVS